MKHLPFFLLAASTYLFYEQDLIFTSFTTLLCTQFIQYFALWNIYKLIKNNQVPSSAFILVIAIVVRIALLNTQPWLEDDYYRYLWDGRVSFAGLNPYQYSPSDSALDFLHTPYREHINYLDLPTIYPPFAQLLFYISHAIKADSLIVLKALFSLFDLLAIFMLSKLLAHLKLKKEFILLYVFHPLVLKELYNSAHIDIVPAALSLCSMYFLFHSARSRRNEALSFGMMALAFATKFYILFWLPIFLMKSRNKIFSVAIFTGVSILMYSPFLSMGVEAFGSLGTFSKEWTFNESLFALINVAVKKFVLFVPAALRPTFLVPALIEGQLARLGSAFLFLIFYLYNILRLKDATQSSIPLKLSNLFLALFLLSPVLNPWYVLWALPLWVLSQRSFLIFAPFFLTFGYAWFESPDLYHFFHFKIYIFALALFCFMQLQPFFKAKGVK